MRDHEGLCDYCGTPYGRSTEDEARQSVFRWVQTESDALLLCGECLAGIAREWGFNGGSRLSERKGERMFVVAPSGSEQQVPPEDQPTVRAAWSYTVDQTTLRHLRQYPLDEGRDR